MISDWKNKIRDWLKANSLLATLLVVSLLANGYLVFQIKESQKQIARENLRPTSVQTVSNGSSVTSIESPYGVRNEVYSKYENGKWKTYSTSTPITEEEVKEMRTTINSRHRALMEYFRKQDELMNQFWNSFYEF